MANEKKDFLVPYTIRSFTSRMTKEQKADFWDAILDYEIDKKEPELSPDVMYAFWFIQDYLKEKREHYEEVGKQRAESGRRGGFASGQARKQKEANEAIANKRSKSKQTKQTKQNEHDNDYDNEYSSVPKVQKNTNSNTIAFDSLPSMEGRRPSAAVECPPEIAERFGGYKQTASYEREEALRKDGFFEMTALEKAEYLERKRNE